MTRPFVQALVICISVLYASCAIAAEDTNEPAPACPTPKLDKTDWRSVDIANIGVRVQVPKRYAEKHWAVKVGDPIVATYQAAHFESFTLEVLPSTGESLQQQKIGLQTDYQGYTECTEAISGHHAIIQSFRGGGEIILGDLRFPPFAVHAVLELAPGRILSFDGSSATRVAQEDLLAIVRTLEFTR
jgi:hypothetical protein